MTIAAAFRLLRDDHELTSGNSDARAAIDQIEAHVARLEQSLVAINLRGRNVGAEHDLAEYEAALGECCQIARTALQTDSDV